MSARSLALAITSAAALTLAASCGDGGSSGPGGFDYAPNPDTGPAEDPGSDGGPGLDVAPDVPQGDPVVKLLEVRANRVVAFVGDGSPELFCGRPMTILARAENIGGRPLRLVVNGEYILSAEPAPDLEEGRWLFTVDPAALMMPESGEPAEQSPNLADGDDVTLTLAALEDQGGQPALPTDESLYDEWTLHVDASAPTVTVTEPSTQAGVPTLTGRAPIRGTVADDYRVGHVEVWFNGDQVADLPAADDETKHQQVDGEIDLMGETTAVAPLEVRAYDACGYEDVWETDKAKVIAWPWLRTFRREAFPLEKNPVINDSQIVDWNDDDYPDIIFATLEGVWVALNGGDAAPGRFEEYIGLTEAQTQQVSVVDLDADGDLDVVTVQSLGAAVGDGLAVFRRMEGTGGVVLQLAEQHPLELTSTSKVRDLIVRDFTNDPEDLARDDVVVVTSGQEDSLLLFKRQNPEAPQDFDQCKPKEVPVGPDGGALADVSLDTYEPDGDVAVETTTIQDCPALFSPPVRSGGVAGIVHVEARDVSGNEGKPDGYTDLIVGAEGKNQIHVFSNRFAEEGILDTAFTQSTINFVWPVANANSNDVQHFCTGNFIELPGVDVDPMDLVAGTSQSGTWRILRGIGNGQFMNHTAPGDTEFPFDVWNMSGTVDEDIGGLVCADFDQDGHEDFGVLSRGSRLLQVHLGDGRGRFNQLSTAGSGTVCESSQECPDGEKCMLTSCDAPTPTCQRPCTSPGECVAPENPRGPRRGPCVNPQVGACQGQLPLGQLAGDSYCGTEPYINPVNEGVGFVIGAQAQSPRVGDFDQDGLPDLLMDFRVEGYGIFFNTTELGDPDNLGDNVFDMEATRALIAPLGKQGAATGGQLSVMGVGDLTGDGKAEIVGFSNTRPFSANAWLKDYQPMGARYRTWFQCSDATGCLPWDKGASAPTVFVWSQGAYGADVPSYPAAYDRMPRNIYNGAEYHGAVQADRIRVIDLQSPNGDGPDGLPDLVFTGASSGTPPSNLGLYVQAAPPEGFWHLPGLLQDAGSMFRPWNGREPIASGPEDFVFMNARGDDVPGIYVATNSTSSLTCGGSLQAVIRFCAWDPQKACQPGSDNSAFCPYWRCWEPSNQEECAKALSLGIGGNAIVLEKLAVEGEEAGQPTDDPDAVGDLLVVSQATGSMSSFRWEGLDAIPPSTPDQIADVFPFAAPSEKAVGETPRDLGLRDLDGDGLVDFATTVKKNVMVAFGQEGFHPFQSPLPVGQEQQAGGPEGVVMTDVNADGFVDVVFTESGRSQITAYLAAGLDANNEYLRQFHGPVELPTCRQPTDIRAHDFDGDGCEDLVVLCEGAGSIAIIANDSCAKAAAP